MEVVMVKIIQEVKNPEILVVTPLLPGHKLSGITKKTLKRNKVPFTWISSEGNQNIPKNALEGISWYKDNKGKLPPYYMMIDRDIEAGRGLLDRLYARLDDTGLNIGFSYATFQFKGHVNRDFPAMPYDINRLIQCNYISSNSMFLSSVIEHVGLVTNDKYKRLLDWAFLLKCFKYGYVGVPEPKAWFIAHSTKDDISAGDANDYQQKYKKVWEDFIQPLF
jgi:hypothetical protein